MAETTNWIKTHCARMDHGGCGIIVGVRNNRIVKIKGDPGGWLNQGYVCPKGLSALERLTHPGRLKQPLLRIGKRGSGHWQKISWPQAIKIIVKNFTAIRESHGARGVAFCQGMPKGLDHFALIRLANIFGSPNVVAIQDVCHAPREITGIHTCGFYPVTDFHHPSRLVMLWASNITATNEEGAICSLLLKQIKNGLDIIVVDPKRTPLAQKAKYWLQIRPGTDIALALAFLNVIIDQGLYDKDFVDEWTNGFHHLAQQVKPFTPEKMADVTQVPPDLIRRAARCYAENHPAAIQWGNPIEQNINAFDTTRALVCLMAICGNLDVPGGNIHALDPPVLKPAKFVRADLIPGKPKEILNAAHGTIARMMTVPPAYFRKAVLKDDPYPVKGAYIQCANPLMAYADSRQTHDALMRLDFLAVADIVMTPTAALADLVLPAATALEFNDIGHYGMGHGYILARHQVVEPPADCWPDIKIINELGKLLTGEKYWYPDWEALLESVVAPMGLTFDDFARQGYLKGEGLFRKYENTGFRTPTGKVELSLSRANALGVPPLPRFEGVPEVESGDYPLVLTSAKDPYYLHSSYRWVETLKRYSPKPVAELHPQTALVYDIREGDEISIETPAGQITQYAHLTDRVAPDVVYAAYGWWFPEKGSHLRFDWKSSNFNMLTTTQKLGREFGTPNLKGIACRIRRKV